MGHCDVGEPRKACQQESAWAKPALETEGLVGEEGCGLPGRGGPRQEASWLTWERQEMQ